MIVVNHSGKYTNIFPVSQREEHAGQDIQTYLFGLGFVIMTLYKYSCVHFRLGFLIDDVVLMLN